MTPDQRDAYEERAAILEYDAKLSRTEAEKQAKEMILKNEKDKSKKDYTR